MTSRRAPQDIEALTALVVQRRRESCAVKEAFTPELDARIAAAAAAMHAVLTRGGCVYSCGNGGSAADAEHLAAELVGRCESPRRALAARALTASGPLATALANDFGFEQVFARQVEATLGPQDLLVAISTSGRSGNVIAAARAAQSRGARVIALTGADGGPLAQLANERICVPSSVVPRIQEAHVFILHMLVELIERLGIDAEP